MTTLNNLDGINSTGGIVRQMRVLTQSGAVIAPTSGKMLLLAAAAGASGAAMNSTTATQRLATGGGAGEIVFDVVEVSAGDTFTATLGAPGAALPSVGVGVSTNGNDASNTTITGPNSYALTVVGGKRGVFVSGAAAANGGDGGTGGTGGSSRVLRFPGGRAGNVTDAAGTARIATGGGGVNAMGLTAQTGTRAGDSTTTNATAAVATGGGAPGGRGGDRTGTGTGNTGGAGAGGSAADNALTAGPNIKGLSVTSSPADIVAVLATYSIDFFGGGVPADDASQAGPGGALGGRTDVNAVNQQAGNFAASAGVVAVTGVGNASSGKPGFGAGSGAVVASNAATLAAVPAGGQAIVVMIFIEE